MTILITGVKGFVGSYLSSRLSKKHKIIGVDKKNGKLQDLRNINNSFFSGLAKKKIDMIIHLAANAQVRDSVKDPGLARENIEIDCNILEFARKNNIKKIVFSSSREVYGNQAIKNYKETDSKTWFTGTPYSAGKVNMESLLSAYKICYGIKYVILRLSNVFGLNDPNYRFIPILFDNIPKDKKVCIFGKEKQMDFTHIDDCVDAIEIVVNKFEILSKQDIPIYNIACAKSTKLIDIARYIKKQLKSKSKIEVKKSHLGEVVYYQANINKFKNLTGWEPKVSVYKGINKMIKK
ncbi:NAD(P)-dependent oxidoreductase [Patescibacteria group bacterium]|nr:NAD(P)-dependent oxidoreductase [Patescibacteria group bacterium]